jgi:DUF1680 family protein
MNDRAAAGSSEPRDVAFPIGRREFLAAAAIGAVGYAGAFDAHGLEPPAVPALPERRAALLEPFDYKGVRLLPSRWLTQVQNARAFYYSVPDDDILHGFRVAAGLPAAGRNLGGWCERDSSMVFGQWVSGMARLSHAAGDDALRAKAAGLVREYAKCIGADGDPRMRHYEYDKLVCGLVDMIKYGNDAEARDVLDRVTAFAVKSFARTNRPGDARSTQGAPTEWYTLSENQYRAFQVTGDAKYRDFAEVWHYTPYWSKFATSSNPADVAGVHAYSHVNTFSSAAMAYEITGDRMYLDVIRNAYEWLQRDQCYVTGLYGPNERMVANDGGLGRSLDTRSDTAETGCGSWSVFKLARYLQRFTGEAKYGDWMERVFYNGVGAGLPTTDGGKNFYYSDYRVGGGMKVYNWEVCTCCSGSYFQDVADYHNLIYYKDAAGILVNLYVPSELSWSSGGSSITLTQATRYPDEDTSTITITASKPAKFALRFRIPEWTRDATITVNGVASPAAAAPGTWARIEQTWKDGDAVTIRLPLVLRTKPVDGQHPDRVAIMRGPVVLVLEGAYHDPNFKLPSDDTELERWIIAEPWRKPGGILARIEAPATERSTIFRVAPSDGSRVGQRMRAFYDVPENFPYFMYFDRKTLPSKFW